MRPSRPGSSPAHNSKVRTASSALLRVGFLSFCGFVASRRTGLVTFRAVFGVFLFVLANNHILCVCRVIVPSPQLNVSLLAAGSSWRTTRPILPWRRSGATDSGATDTAVSSRVSCEVLLVIFLCIVKLVKRFNFGCDAGVTRRCQSRLIGCF